MNKLPNRLSALSSMHNHLSAQNQNSCATTSTNRWGRATSLLSSQFLKHLSVLLLLFVIGVGSSWGETIESISLISYTVTNGKATVLSSSGNATVELSKTSGNVSGAASNNRGIRWQQNNIITVSLASGYKIKSVKLTTGGFGNNSSSITYTLTDGSNNLSGNWDNDLNTSNRQQTYTWTAGNSTSYNTWKLTNTGSSGDLYVSAVDVTYESTGSTSPVDPAITFNNGTYTIGGSALDLSTLFTSNSTGAVTYTVTNANGTGATVNSDGSNFTATAAGNATVQVSQAAVSGTYNEKTATATITVNAAATSYTLSYELFGHGSSQGSWPTSGSVVPSLSDPNTDTYYTFNGWYTNSGLTTQATVGATLSKNTTFYAKWTKTTPIVAISEATSCYFGTTPSNTTNFDWYGTIQGGGDHTKATAANSSCSNALKFDSKGSLTFSLSTPATVDFYFADGDASKIIKVDGAQQTVDSNSKLSLNLAAGTHTMTRNSDALFLFLVNVTPQAPAAGPTATFLYGTSATTGTQWVSPSVDEMTITIPAHKANQDFTVNVTPEDGANILNCENASANQNVVTITAPAAGDSKTVTIPVAKSGNQTNYTIVVKTEAATGITFNENTRYSQLVIDKCLTDGFYANTKAANLTNVTSSSTLDYVPGLVAKGIIEAVDYYKDHTNSTITTDKLTTWFNAVKKYGGSSISDNGKAGKSFDDLNAVKIYFGLKDVVNSGKIAGLTSDDTWNTKLSSALTAIGTANTTYSISLSHSTYPITISEMQGGWWHKSGYINQMWGDGQYMGTAFLAQLINDTDVYDANNSSKRVTADDWALVAKQIKIAYQYLWDSSINLPHHAFAADKGTNSTSHSDTWKFDGSNYRNEAVWGRAAGWFFLALVDILEQMPSTNSNYSTLKGYLENLASGLKARQDATTGCWYQLPLYDNTFSAATYNNGGNGESGRVYNFLESSATALYTTAYLKAIRLGLLDKSTYETTAKNAYQGMVEHFMTSDNSLYWCSRSAGLGGSGDEAKAGAKKFRDGSNEYYLKGYDVVPTRVTDSGTTYPKGTEGKVLGAFIMAATEYERAYLDAPVAGYTANFNGNGKTITITSLKEPNKGQGIILPAAAYSSDEITSGIWKNASDTNASGPLTSNVVPESGTYYEVYRNAYDSSIGNVLTQTISGLSNDATYEIVLSVGASFTSGRGFTCPTGNDLTVAFAGNKSVNIPVYDRETIAAAGINKVVFVVTPTDGSITFGLRNIAPSGNWFVAKLESIKKVDNSDFGGWYVDQTCTTTRVGDAGDNAMVDYDGRNFYAKWNSIAPTPVGSTTVQISRNYAWGWLTERDKVTSIDLSAAATALGCEASAMKLLLWNGSDYVEATNNANYSPIIDDSGTKEDTNIGSWFTQDGNITDWGNNNYWFATINNAHTKIYVAHMMNMEANPVGSEAFGTTFRLTNADGSKYYDITLEGKILQKYVAPTITINGNWITFSQPEGQGGKMYYKYSLQKPGDVTTTNNDGSTTDNQVSFFIPFATYTDGWIQAYCQDELITNIYASGCRTSDITKYGAHTVIPSKPIITQGTGSDKNKVTITVPDNVYDRREISPFYIEYKINGGESHYADNQKSVVIELTENSTISAQIGCYYQKKDDEYSETLSDHWSVSGFAELAVVLDASTVITPVGTKAVNVAKEYNDGWATTAVEIPNFSDITSALGESPVFAYMSNGQLTLQNDNNTNAGSTDNSKGWFFTQGGSVITSSSLSTDAYYSVSYSTSTHKLYIGLTEGCASYSGQNTNFGGDVYLANADGSKCYKITISGTISKGVKSIKIGHTTISDVTFTDNAFDTQLKFYGQPTIEVTLSDDTKPTLTHNRVDDLSQISTATFSMNNQTYTIKYKMKNVSAEALTAVSSETSWNFESGNDPYALTIGTEIITNMNWGNIMLFASEAAHLHIGGRGSAILQTIGAGQKTSRSIAIKVAGAGTFTFNNGTTACNVKVLNDAGEEVGSFIAEKGANNNVWNDSKFTYVGDASILYFVPQRSTGIERLNRVTYSPLSTYLKSVTVDGASLDVTTLVNTGSITVDTRYYEAPTVNYTYFEEEVQKEGSVTPDANGVCTITVGGVDYTINFTNIKSATALTVTHPYTKVYLGKKSTDGYTPRGDVWTVYKGDNKAEESDYSFSTATSNKSLLTVNATSGNIKPESNATGSATVTVTATPSASLEGFAEGIFAYQVQVSQQKDENHTGVEALTALDKSWSWTPADVKSGVYYQDYLIGDESGDYIMVKSSDTGSDGIRAKAQANAQVAFKLGATMKVKIYNKANATRYWVLSTENSSDIADYTYGSSTDLNQPYATVILSAGTYYLGAKDASSNAATQLYLQKIEFEKIETQSTGDNYEIIFESYKDTYNNNGDTHKKNGNVISSNYFFTRTGGSHNEKYSGVYGEDSNTITVNKGLKMENGTTITFTTKSQTAKVIVVQSTENNGSKTFSFDGNAQNSGTEVGTTAKEFIIENVTAGIHTIARTKDEMGLLYIKVIEGEILPYVTFTDNSEGNHTKPYTVSLDVAKAKEEVEYTIYYTTNGKKPTPEDKLTYDGSPIQINTTTTITAVPVWNSNASEGEVTSETFEVKPDYSITISATDVQHTSQHTVSITDVIKGTIDSGATTNLSEGENKVASINVTITVSGKGLAYIMYGVNGPESENVYVEAINGTATVTLKAQQFKDATSYSIIGYDEYGNASEEFTHTYMLYEPMLYRPVAGTDDIVPGKPRPIYLDDDEDKGVAVTMISGTNIGWENLGSEVWGTERKSQESVTGAMDGMVVTATPAYDAYTEKVIINGNGTSGEYGRKAQVYGTNLNNEFDLPVLGAFYKFYPKMKGTLSVYVLVNGPEEVKDKTHNANVCRHRRIYVQDETGSVVPFTVESSNEACIGTRFFAVHDPEDLESIFQEQGETAPGNESDRNTYKWLLSKLQANWTAWGNTGAAPATIADLRTYGQTDGKSIKHKAWINNAASNASTIDDGKPINDNSIEVIAKSFVKINIPVMPGKTYYLSGNLTKISCSGFKFAPDARQPQVQEITMGVTATPTLTANTVANVTLNRTFTKDKWTSLVLPFSVSEVQLQEIFGDEVGVDDIAKGTKMLNQQKVTTFHFNGVTGSQLNLYEHYYDMVRAGRPIFIRPTKTVENPVFKNVTIEKTGVEADLTNAADAEDNGGYMVTGRYSYLENNAPIGSYYLATNKTTGITSFSTNTSKTVTIKPTIAFIKPQQTASQQNTLVVKIQSVKEDGVGFDEATGILDVFEDMGVDAVVVTSSTKVYNTQGQVVAEGIDSLDELPTGIYIVNGKKYVVK